VTDLADLIPDSGGVSFRRGRVISLSGRSLTVDLGAGEAGIIIPSLDSCNPVPNQWVLIMVDGSSMVAVGALNGAYRQPTLIATSNQTSTVTGLLNGVSTAVTKVGSFTASAGEEFPLVWSADGSGVWVLAKAGAAYVPPPSGGGGTGGGGGTTPSSYTTNYPATKSHWFAPGRGGGGLYLDKGTGVLDYGTNRMNELQGRTILSGRVLLERLSGSGTVVVAVYKGSLQSGSDGVSPSGWVNLNLARVAQLVNGTGATSLYLTGGGQLKGTPSGTVQIRWRP
jgi:hypothetical protein